MSFGRPPGQLTFSPSPPERGSFPLDHDGECKPVMKDYLDCLKKVRGTNDPECRLLAKAYLQCRMDRNLMARDSFENLGFQDEASKKKNAYDVRLEELRRENERLKRKAEEEAKGKKE